MIGPARIEAADGSAVSFDGEFLVARVSRPFAPGTPIRGSLTIGELEIQIEGRATGSKRMPDGTFEIRARLINLRREDRLRLEAASRGA